MIYHFANCILNTRLHILSRAGRSTQLSRKVFEVLCYLIEHREHIVSKQELCEQIWEGLAISDATLESCLRNVRASVGDSGQTQRVIRTQRSYGYQFVADITVEESVGGREESLAPPVVPLDAPEPAPPTPLFEPVILPRPGPQPGLRLCIVCEYANREDATFCATCGTRLRQSCVHCGQDSPLGAAFCPACGQSLAASAPPDLAPTPTGPAERKPITVLCCTVTPTTTQGARADLDALHSLLQELYAIAQDIVRQYGGRLHPVMGERFLILFGVPVAQEDNARRAVHVALELRRRLAGCQERLVAATGAALALRMGLHTGLVVVEGLRPEGAAETAGNVVGDVVSLATALQEQAAPGTILCSAATARLLRGTVRLETKGPVQVPGQPAPVEVYNVLGRSFRRSPMAQHRRRGLSPFVGRERELATLHALLAQVMAGRGQVVGVVGEAGLGKSRLVYEFRRSLGRKRLLYLTGRCLSYGSTTPYLPALDLLRHNCGITDIDDAEDITAKVHHGLQGAGMAPAEWGPVLLHLLGLQTGTNPLATLSPEAHKARIQTALTQLCLNGSRPQPLILEIEDLHWIDASSEECLAALVERMAGASIMLLGTYRPGYRPAWIDKSYVTQVALQPLSSQNSLRVVQSVLPTAVHNRTPAVSQLLAKADGNPFFLEELARTVVEQGADMPAHTVPDTVQAVLLARIDRLPATAKRLLQAAAVIGKDVALPLLQAVTDVPEEAMHRDLGHLQAAEFLYETYTPTTPAYTFKHVLTQEVASQSLVRRARQQYHERIAQVLEERFPEVVEAQPERLAQHYTEADRGALALPYWQRAGQRAAERSANVEALSHFTRGLEVLRTLPDTPESIRQELELQLALGPLLRMIKGHTAPEVEHTYTRAHDLSQQMGDGPQRFSVLVSLWRFYINRAQIQTAHELAEQCFAFAQHVQDPVLLQDAHQMLGSTLFFQGEPVPARAHLEQGLMLYDAQQGHLRAFSGGMDPGVACLSAMAWTLWMLGYPNQALAKIRDALTLAQESSHAYSLGFALNYASMLHVWRREVQCAKERAEAVITLSNEHGFIHAMSVGMIRRGWALAKQGVVAEGIRQLNQGLATIRDTGTELPLSHHLALLAEAYRQGGQIDAGLHVLAEALIHMDKTWERGLEAEIYRLTGECHLVQADAQRTANGKQHQVDKAEECLHQALDVARRQQAKSLELRAALSLGRLWQQQDRGAEAHQMLAELYSWFTEGLETPDLQEAKALLEALQ